MTAKPRKQRIERQMEARHRQFADLYLRDPSRNAAQAYQQTYPNASPPTAWSNASKLLKHAIVAAYIAEREAELTKAAKIEQSYVLAGFKKIAEIGTQTITVRSRKKGGAVYDTLVDGTNGNRALEALARTQKMFVDRVESSVTHRFEFIVKK